jgi:hypothetical protein
MWADSSEERICGIQQNAIMGLRPVFFVPGTLVRTWGTRPFPSDFA